jgi:CubicO group peptidase (beta-lactamase class C family)
VPIAVARIQGDQVETEYFNCGPETRFEIGSISKVLTAILLCEAVDEGKCKLDDTLDKYLPKGIRTPRYFGRKITLEHLARHISGLPRLPRKMSRKEIRSNQPYARWDKNCLLNAISTTILQRPPGSTYEYSNFGFATLGLALEGITGNSFSSLLGNLTNRLECPGVRLPEPDDAAIAAQGRTAKGARVQPWNMAAFGPAGGCTSNLESLVAFAKNHLKPDIPRPLQEAMSNRKRVSTTAPLGSGAPITLLWLILLIALAVIQPQLFAIPVLIILYSTRSSGFSGALLLAFTWVSIGIWQQVNSTEFWGRIVFGVVASAFALVGTRKEHTFQMGLGWHIFSSNEKPCVWHNGGTAGFRSFIAIQQETGKAVVVLGGRESSVDQIGVELLKGSE